MDTLKFLIPLFTVITLNGCSHNNTTSQVLVTKEDTYQNDKVRFETLVAPLNKKRKHLENEVTCLREQGRWNDSLQTAYWGKEGLISKVDDTYDSQTAAFIVTNINTTFGLEKLEQTKNYVTIDFIREQLGKLSPKKRNTINAKRLQTHLDFKPLSPGDAFYDFEAVNEEGCNLKLGDQFINQEKYVLLEFFSAHCGWCIQSIPPIKQLEKENLTQLEIITVNVDDDKEGFVKQRIKHNIDRPFFWLEKGRKSEVYIKYHIAGTPSYFLFNNEGVLLQSWTGFDDSSVAQIKNRIAVYKNELTVVNAL